MNRLFLWGTMNNLVKIHKPIVNVPSNALNSIKVRFTTPASVLVEVACDKNSTKINYKQWKINKSELLRNNRRKMLLEEITDLERIVLKRLLFPYY